MGGIAQVKALGWRGDVLEVMWVNSEKEESKARMNGEKRRKGKRHFKVVKGEYWRNDATD